MAVTYNYDLFISYASANRDWAQRLYDDLVGRGVSPQRVFLDTRRLQPGATWEPQLAAGVRETRHLVALWSDAANASDWVREEMIRFKVEIDPNGSGPLTAERQLFQLVIAPVAQSPVMSRYHAFTSLKGVDVAAGPAVMSAPQLDSWNAIVTDLVETLIPPVPGTPWPVAVFATTATILGHESPRRPSGFPGTFDAFLATLGIPDYATFQAQYDGVPQDWRPFGLAVPVSAMLDKLLLTVNGQLAATPGRQGGQMRWQYVDLITTAFDRLDDEVQKLSTGSCVLILDPLTLLIPGMKDRYDGLLPCFENKAAVILWLTPFKSHQPLVDLRETVRRLARPLIIGYYEPLPPRTPFGRCALNLSDEFELTRMVLSAVAEMPAPAGSVAGNSVLGVGERRP